MKNCRCCGALKPLTEFYDRGDRPSGQKRSECKSCWGARTRRWAGDNKQRLSVLYKMKNIETKYGITREQYAQMLEDQGHCCAACGDEFVGVRGRKAPCVDHCHSSGKVRGILCAGCNVAIGFAGERTDALAGMIIYLEKRATSG